MIGTFESHQSVSLSGERGDLSQLISHNSRALEIDAINYYNNSYKETQISLSDYLLQFEKMHEELSNPRKGHKTEESITVKN